MPEVEALLAIHLDECALPRRVARVLEDVAQEHEAGAVVEPVRDHHLRPRLERDVERVRVAEVGGVALVDQGVGVDPEVSQHAVGDVRVAELVLDDPDHGHEGLESRRVRGGLEVCRGADQLRVAGHDQRPCEPLHVVLARVLRPFDQLSSGEPFEDGLVVHHASLTDQTVSVNPTEPRLTGRGTR